MSRPPETPPCPRCGAPHGPDQEYCLECGYRLQPPAGAFGRLSAAWQRRFGWYPGDWIWPVLLGFLIAVAGATAAIVLADAGAENSPIVATHGGTLAFAGVPGVGTTFHVLFPCQNATGAGQSCPTCAEREA